MQAPARRPPVALIVIGAVLAWLVVSRGVLGRDDLLIFAVLIPSIILHEVSHGAVALLFGDDTAKRAGRLTLNPLRHVDPFGTVILPAMLILTTGSGFGYAKPVPVSPRRLRRPRDHGLVVSLAGPAVNITLAVAAGLLLRVTSPHARFVSELPLWAEAAFYAGYINVILAAFNLIPIPPLDGSAVIERLLPMRWWPGYLRLRQYSMGILIAVVLLAPGFLSRVFDPAIDLWWRLLS